MMKATIRRPAYAIAATCSLVCLFAVSAYFIRCSRLGSSAPEQVAQLPNPEPPPPLYKEIAGTFKPRQNITETLTQYGLSIQDVYQLVTATRPVYNLAKIKAGQPYWLYLTREGEFHDFRYPVDENHYLTVYRDASHQFVSVLKEFLYETRVDPVCGTIDGSLFTAVINTGEKELLAMELADIFGWDIDFYTDIQKGDSFRMLVEKKYLDGQFKRYGAILAAGITNRNKQFTGIRFQDGQGKPAYFDPDGKALKKSFLKSPLKFARVSSGFSTARMHPILKIVRPHLGVDYAAPLGTPVQAVGSGTVESAGWSGDSGRMVKLRHVGAYETMYLHLSKIAVRAGARVGQGDVIGYVGATGLATGPHLDFRILLHGRFINPTKVIFPPAPPVPPNAFARFAVLRDSWLEQLAQLGE